MCDPLLFLLDPSLVPRPRSQASFPGPFEKLELGTRLIRPLYILYVLKLTVWASSESQWLKGGGVA